MYDFKTIVALGNKSGTWCLCVFPNVVCQHFFLATLLQSACFFSFLHVSYIVKKVFHNFFTSNKTCGVGGPGNEAIEMVHMY